MHYLSMAGSSPNACILRKRRVGKDPLLHCLHCLPLMVCCACTCVHACNCVCVCVYSLIHTHTRTRTDSPTSPLLHPGINDESPEDVVCFYPFISFLSLLEVIVADNMFCNFLVPVSRMTRFSSIANIIMKMHAFPPGR
jgi:hypothetical protein